MNIITKDKNEVDFKTRKIKEFYMSTLYEVSVLKEGNRVAMYHIERRRKGYDDRYFTDISSASFEKFTEAKKYIKDVLRKSVFDEDQKNIILKID